MYALSPTPELWSHVVPNRTQIVQVSHDRDHVEDVQATNVSVSLLHCCATEVQLDKRYTVNGIRTPSVDSRGGKTSLNVPTFFFLSVVSVFLVFVLQDFDQSIVIFRLDLKPGDLVVESGTGSGVMSSVSVL